MGIGDLVILIANIQAISKHLGQPVTVLAQKNTHASAILKNDTKHIEEIIELNDKEIKDFFNIIKKIKPKKFDQGYILSDSLRLYLICKLSGIKQVFSYSFFSKKGKNFYKTAKEFTEKILNEKVDSQSKIFLDQKEVDETKKKYANTNEIKNLCCGISASGKTKRWPIDNYISLFENLSSKFQCKFFLMGGPKDEELIKRVMNSPVGKNCISFSNNTISEILPVIGSCQYYIGNDTGFGHISAALGLKSLFLFLDSPVLAYGKWSKNISVVLPEGETEKTTVHDTLGTIKTEKVFTEAVKLLSN